VILGAGPAGLAALSEADKVGVDCVLIDCNSYGIASVDVKHFTQQSINVKKTTGRFGGTARFWGNQIAYLSIQDESNWRVIGRVEEDFFYLLNSELKTFLAQNLNSRVSPLKIFKRNEIRTSLYQTRTFYPKNDAVINQIKVKKVLSRTKLIEKEISELEILGQYISYIRFSDKSQFKIGPNDAVIVALGCVESAKLLARSLIKSDKNQDLFFGGLVDHPAGNVLKFQMPRLAKKIPRKHKERNHKKLFESIEQNGHVFRSARCEIKLEDEEMPFRLALRELLLDFKLSRATILIRYLLRRILPYFVFSRIIKCNYLVWIQIEQLPNPNIGISFAGPEPVSNWKLTEDDKVFILRTSTVMQEYVEEEFQPSYVSQLVSKDTIDSKFMHAFHPSSLLSSNVELHANKLKVDIFGRIRGLENCRVASTAIFPTSGWFNPTLTLVLISKIITRSLLLKGYFQESVKC